jgi:hypothetical protein
MERWPVIMICEPDPRLKDWPFSPDEDVLSWLGLNRWIKKPEKGLWRRLSDSCLQKIPQRYDFL